MDYERLLCATGPYEGEIKRASDKEHPHRIAWIQCVGSRRITEGNNSYCSAVCCTYTQKQVILTKDHDPDAECTIFHNDIRSYGKDFERFYQRSANLPGVRFIRSYVSIGKETPGTKNITVRYSTEQDGVKEEEFDLVVLSVGLNPTGDAEKLAQKFGIELNSHNFCETNPFNPMETTRQGIFVSGAFQGPVDIPESVFTASGASSQSGALLDFRRGKLSRQRKYPLEKDVSKDDPRVGVFVCHCGANIGRVVNVPSTVEFALTLPKVVYAQEQLFSCASNCAEEITQMIEEKGLNRVVIAACSPRTLEPLFRDTLREAGLNQYYLDMANIREHCSWVHSKEPEDATRKAKEIVAMSVARVCHLEALQEFDLPINREALVVGGGVAGMTCALSIAEQGHPVHLVEKDKVLGGTTRKIYYTLEGQDVQKYLNNLIKKVYEHPLVSVYTDATITDSSGYVGNFVTKIKSERGLSEIKHGVTVLATGADLYTPTEYLYGKTDRVLTQLELEDKLEKREESLVTASNLVMVQCVGCRNEERNYCSRVCCGESIKNALKLKEVNPAMDIYILYRDMRTYGFREDYYRAAADKEVKFLRYEPENTPRVEAVNEYGRNSLRITVPDPILGKMIAIDADFLVLAAAIIPSARTKETASLFKVTLSPDGFLKEAHVKLKPVEFATDGVYLCGMAHYPKYMPEAISQAYGAASRALTLLSHDTITASGSVCSMNEKRCIGCGACVKACTYGAIELQDVKGDKKARVNPVLCKGCGLCNSKCPTRAVSLKHFTHEELLSQIYSAFPIPAIVQK
jgi:heterodisulfide reductase subunit A2